MDINDWFQRPNAIFILQFPLVRQATGTGMGVVSEGEGGTSAL